MRIEVNGFTMNVEVEGLASAPPVILHHPLATNLSVWDELTAALLPAFRVIRFDARGHGGSQATPAPYDWEMLAADVVALMDHLGIERARFLGLSMGGMVGQHLGLLHPHRFHSLTLVSTSSEMASLGAQIWADRVRFAREKGMAGVVDGAMARWVAPAILAGANPDLVARLRAMILSTPVEGYVGWCEAIAKLDVTARLPLIHLPTLVIVGALDPATPPSAARIIAAGIPGARLIEMPGVSHMLQVEAPDAFHAHVLPFLADHGPTA